MKKFSYRLIPIVLRLLISISLFLLGFYFISIADKGFPSLPQIFFGMACFMVGAFLIAGPIARLISSPAGALYFPKGETETVPMYGMADSFEKRGMYFQALDEYKKIAERYPAELRPYIEMINIAIEHLNDFGLASSIRDKGISIFKGREGEKVLREMVPERGLQENEIRVIDAFDEALKKLRK